MISFPSSPAHATLNALNYCFGCDIGNTIYHFCEPTWAIEIQNDTIAGFARGTLHYNNDFLRCQHVYLRFAADDMELDFFFIRHPHCEFNIHSIRARLGDRAWYSNVCDTFCVSINNTTVWAQSKSQHCWSLDDCIKSLERAAGVVVNK